MRMWGLTMADYESDNTVFVYPDCWPAAQFFVALGNGSWNMGPNGPAGLRNEAFREVRLALRVKAADWPKLFADLRVIEQAALDEIHKD